MHDLRHHYKVFSSAVLKWWKVLRIKKIFYMTGQKVRYKKSLAEALNKFEKPEEEQ